MYTILVCDDEKDIVSALNIYLSAEGYRVLTAYDGYQALRLLDREEVHLILLDVMMPGMDGITAMTRLRQSHNLPVILLTAKSEDTDKVLGLNMGADDYVTKPFNPVELLARVRSQLRRYMTLGGGHTAPSAVTIGGVSLDDNAKTVTVDGDTGEDHVHHHHRRLRKRQPPLRLRAGAPYDRAAKGEIRLGVFVPRRKHRRGKGGGTLRHRCGPLGELQVRRGGHGAEL